MLTFVEYIKENYKFIIIKIVFIIIAAFLILKVTNSMDGKSDMREGKVSEGNQINLTVQKNGDLLVEETFKTYNKNRIELTFLPKREIATNNYANLIEDIEVYLNQEKIDTMLHKANHYRYASKGVPQREDRVIPGETEFDGLVINSENKTNDIKVRYTLKNYVEKYKDIANIDFRGIRIKNTKKQNSTININLPEATEIFDVYVMEDTIAFNSNIKVTAKDKLGAKISMNNTGGFQYAKIYFMIDSTAVDKEKNEDIAYRKELQSKYKKEKREAYKLYMVCIFPVFILVPVYAYTRHYRRHRREYRRNRRNENKDK